LNYNYKYERYKIDNRHHITKVMKPDKPGEERRKISWTWTNWTKSFYLLFANITLGVQESGSKE